jgi:hypothetical protein
VHWIFASVVFLAVVFLLVRFPRFRRWFAIIVLGVMVVGAVGGVGAYLYNERETDRLRGLIKPGDLKLEGLRLTPPSSLSSYWEVKGKVMNVSQHSLQAFTLKITVKDCPDPNSCIVVGESNDSVWVEVPPNQMRAFSDLVTFQNLPQLVGMRWDFVLTEARAKSD